MLGNLWRSIPTNGKVASKERLNLLPSQVHKLEAESKMEKQTSVGMLIWDVYVLSSDLTPLLCNFNSLHAIIVKESNKSCIN